ncbi:MAG: precorrin-6y C5,15-methyltransferase (decarboxylating) subunit CbiE [Leptospirales bacterium]
MTKKPSIHIIGVEPEGVAPSRAPLSDYLPKTALVIGGKRHLEPLREVLGKDVEFLRITSNIPEVVARLLRFAEESKPEKNAIVLATGDPLYYGIGAPIAAALPAGSFSVHPATTLVQRSFALLGEPWEKVSVGSLHSKKESPKLHPGRWAFYTGGSAGVREVCTLVLEKGFGIRKMALLEEIGMAGERVRHFEKVETIGILPDDVKALNMVVMTIEEGSGNEK